MNRLLFIFLFSFIQLFATAEDGYRLWLRYDKITNGPRLQEYNKAISGIYFPGTSPTLSAAKEELLMGLQGLLGRKISLQNTATAGTIVAGTSASSSLIRLLIPKKSFDSIGEEGFIIRSVSQGQQRFTIISANTDVGVLYGSFHLLRLLQTGQSLQRLSITSAPRIRHRVLNHWDNLNRYVERGYAGISIWDWHKLPGYIDQRYIDYARANASIGINGTVLTNVNANALVLSKDYLQKVAALADVFRPYGIKVFLTARFSAPIELGKLKTADPLDDGV